MTGGRTERLVLVVHPSPDLYGSDRMLVEAVRQMVEVHGRVVVVLPSAGRLVPLLVAAGAEVWLVPTLVLGKRLLRPRGWPVLLRDAVVGTLAAVRVLERLRPSAVYVNTLTLPLWPLLARCSGARTVVHVHEAERDLPWPARALLTIPAGPAHHVVANSEFTGSVIGSAVPVLRRKMSVIHNGVAGPVARPSDPRAACQNGLRILYVGRLSERKGVHLLVDVVRTLVARGVDAELDVVGDVYPGYGWFEERLHDDVAAAGITERVRFRGFHPEVWPWLDAADVVVVPSVGTESFGNTAVEAVLAARPVVVADHSGLREAVAGLDCAQRVDTRGPAAVAGLTDALVRVRDDWEHFRAAALADEAVVRARHRPEEFGRRVAAAVTVGSAGTDASGSRGPSDDPEGEQGTWT